MKDNHIAGASIGSHRAQPLTKDNAYPRESPSLTKMVGEEILFGSF